MESVKTSTKTGIKTILSIVVPGWTIGVSVLTYPALLYFAPSYLSGAEDGKEILIFLSFFVMTPVTAFFQSLIVSLICFIGLRVFDLRRKQKPLTI